MISEVVVLRSGAVGSSPGSCPGGRGFKSPPPLLIFYDGELNGNF